MVGHTSATSGGGGWRRRRQGSGSVMMSGALANAEYVRHGGGGQSGRASTIFLPKPDMTKVNKVNYQIKISDGSYLTMAGGTGATSERTADKVKRPQTDRTMKNLRIKSLPTNILQSGHAFDANAMSAEATIRLDWTGHSLSID
jgi:hypothetical protein